MRYNIKTHSPEERRAIISYFLLQGHKWHNNLDGKYSTVEAINKKFEFKKYPLIYISKGYMGGNNMQDSITFEEYLKLPKYERLEE